jgi:hypothetical protein
MLIPISNQGSGKTYYYNKIMEPTFEKDPNIGYKILSSEIVNKQLIDEYLITFPDLNREEAYQKTRSYYKMAYNNEIRNIFFEIYKEVLDHINSEKENPKHKIYMVYIDKNHPLNDSSQAKIHKRFRNISECQYLRFISVNLKARELICEEKQELRPLLNLPK